MGLILVIQIGLRPLEQRFFAHRRAHRLELRLLRGEANLAAVEGAVMAADVRLRGLRVRPARGGREDRVELDLELTHNATATALLDTLRSLNGVRLVDYSLGAARPSQGATAIAPAAAPVDDDEGDDDGDENMAFRG